MTTYFKTTIVIEVLSEDEPLSAEGGNDLVYVADAITTGDCSGVVSVSSIQELTPVEAAQALLAQGSAPEFFGLDETGTPVV